MFDRYALCRCLLGGDAGARLVLADLLYEAGEEELAAFARGPFRRQREAELELVLRIVPAPFAIELGCGFFEHVLSSRPTPALHWSPHRRTIGPAWLPSKLARIRRLLAKNAPHAGLMAQGRSLAATPWRAFRGMDASCLQEAAQCLGTALEEIDAPGAAGIAVAALAEVLRSHLGVQRLELEWQFERTQQMLEKLLADAEATGMPSFGQEDRVEVNVDRSTSHDQDNPGNYSW